MNFKSQPFPCWVSSGDILEFFVLELNFSRVAASTLDPAHIHGDRKARNAIYNVTIRSGMGGRIWVLVVMLDLMGTLLNQEQASRALEERTGISRFQESRATGSWGKKGQRFPGDHQVEAPTK